MEKNLTKNFDNKNISSENNFGSIKAYCRAGWIIEGVIRGRYLVDNEPMDQILVSCNNPLFFPKVSENYNILELENLNKFRKELFT